MGDCFGMILLLRGLETPIFGIFQKFVFEVQPYIYIIYKGATGATNCTLVEEWKDSGESVEDWEVGWLSVEVSVGGSSVFARTDG